MARMTEEEAWALDDEVTRNPPAVAGSPGGFFTDRRDRMVILDQLSAGYIKSAAVAEHKTNWCGKKSPPAGSGPDGG